MLSHFNAKRVVGLEFGQLIDESGHVATHFVVLDVVFSSLDVVSMHYFVFTVVLRFPIEEIYLFEEFFFMELEFSHLLLELGLLSL